MAKASPKSPSKPTPTGRTIDPFSGPHYYAGKLHAALGPEAAKEWATIPEVVKSMKRTRQCVHRWLKIGAVKFKKHGRVVLISRASLAGVGK